MAPPRSASAQPQPDAEQPDVIASPDLRWIPSDPTAASLALARLSFPPGMSAERVLIARSDAFADALAAGVLQSGAPLLLVDGTAPVPTAVAAEIERLEAGEALVLGGEGAVSRTTADSVAALGLSVLRIAGSTRLATAAAIADEVAGQRTDGVDAVMLARAFGDGGDETRAFADSLAAGSLAAEAGRPILLTQTDVLSGETEAALIDLQPREVILIGGGAAVGAAVEGRLDELGFATRRLAGSTRVETAEAVQGERSAFRAVSPLSGATRPGGASQDDDGAQPSAHAVVLDAGAPDAWVAGFASASLASATGAAVVLSAGGLSDAARAGLANQSGPLVCAGDSGACADAASAMELAPGTAVTVTPPNPGPGEEMSVTVEGASGDIGLLGTCISAATSIPSGGSVALAGDVGSSCHLVITSVDADGVTQTAIATVLPGRSPQLAGVPDFATHVLGDPWDYDNIEDIVLAPGTMYQAWNARLEEGELRFSTNAGHVHLLWQGMPGAIAMGRDGALNPIDPGRFGRVQVRVHSSVETLGVVGSQMCLEPPGHCSLNHTAPLRPGWQTIEVEPNWDGPVYGLRFGATGAADLRVDWARVIPTAQPSTTVAGVAPLQITAGPEGDIQPVLDGTTFSLNGAPNGTYTLTGADGVSSELEVVEPPRIQITNPDDQGGEDYITATTGDAWDFDQPTDVTRFWSTRNQRFEGGVLFGTNTSNDPGVDLRMGPVPLDPTRYHRVTLRFGNEGPADLSFNPGGGSMARLLWGRSDNFQTGNDIVSYAAYDSFTFSMLDPLALEPGVAPWTTQPVEQLRFDPNEDPGARNWTIDKIAIRADDEASGPFVVDIAETRADEGLDATQLTVALDTDRVGFDGKVLGTGTSTTGTGVEVDTCQVPPGTYWVHVTGTRGDTSASVYATGPLQVDHSAC